VLGEACRQLARWRSDGVVGAGVPVSVNLSARTLRAANLIDAVDHALSTAGIAPACLSLELTEMSLETDAVHGAVDDVARLGVRLCLDDFGADRSTFAALTSHPLDMVKIRATPHERMLATLIGAVRAIDVDAIVQRIESASELETARELGAVAGQGFVIAAPAAVEEVSRWLASRQ
jgi:EAL domain-containing protein (putative c-di-GMP-specific phosphodiesterase class I)